MTETTGPHAAVTTMTQTADTDQTTLTAGHGTTRHGSGTAGAAAETTTIAVLHATTEILETDEIVTVTETATTRTAIDATTVPEIGIVIETAGGDTIRTGATAAARKRVDSRSIRARSGSIRKRHRSSTRIISR